MRKGMVMESIGELSEFFGGCAETYRFLAQAFYKELNDEAIDVLVGSEWPEGTGNAHLDEGYALLRRYFAFGVPDRRQQLAVEYARIFLAAGVYTKETRCAIPYESVYTSEEHIMMQESRDDVVVRFREDGFQVDPSLHEPEDHLSFELEYLQVMSERALELAGRGDEAGLRRNMERQREFIELHLLNWLPTLREVAAKFATLPFYTGLLLVAQGALEQARDYLSR